MSRYTDDLLDSINIDEPVQSGSIRQMYWECFMGCTLVALVVVAYLIFNSDIQDTKVLQQSCVYNTTEDIDLSRFSEDVLGIITYLDTESTYSYKFRYIIELPNKLTVYLEDNDNKRYIGDSVLLRFDEDYLLSDSSIVGYVSSGDSVYFVTKY